MSSSSKWPTSAKKWKTSLSTKAARLEEEHTVMCTKRREKKGKYRNHCLVQQGFMEGVRRGRDRQECCGVTWEPLTYCPWAILQTSWSKFRFGAGPKLKYLTTAWHTRGWVPGKPCFVASISSFRTMFCLRKLSKSSSSVEMLCTLDAILERKENLEGSRDHPMGVRNAG